MKKLFNLIQKYDYKYPGWLFKWLVRKHWLYPKPKLLSNKIYMSNLGMIRGNLRDVEYEVRRRLIEELWENITYLWQKYSYSPSSRDIHIEQRQVFEDGYRAWIIRVECRYNPHFTYGQMRDFIQEVEKGLA